LKKFFSAPTFNAAAALRIVIALRTL